MQSINWHWGDAFEPLQSILDRGGIVGFPTESSYAIGADPTSTRGVESVFEIKRRSKNKPLPVVLAELSQLKRLGGNPDQTLLQRLADVWPAPLTAIVPIEKPLPATLGNPWLGIRIPAHEKLRDLLRRLDRPLTETSANLSGQPPVSDPEMLPEIFGEHPSLIVDDGLLRGGDPSTVVRIGPDSATVLRRGAFPIDRLERQLGVRVFSATPAEIPADEFPETR